MWNQRDITVHRALTLPMTGLALTNRSALFVCDIKTRKEKKRKKINHKLIIEK